MIEPTTAVLEEAIRQFVALGSQLNADTHVIAGNRRGSAPPSLYATVLSIGAEPDGVHYTSYAARTDGGLDVTTVNTVRARYSVQWYRAGARDAARRFGVWVHSPAGLDAAAERALTCLQTSEIRQIDGVISNAWEERAGLDLDLGYLEKVMATSDSIETVPLELDFGGATTNFEVTHGG